MTLHLAVPPPGVLPGSSHEVCTHAGIVQDLMRQELVCGNARLAAWKVLLVSERNWDYSCIGC